MTVTLIGKLEYKSVELGCWVLVTSEGKIYQLYRPTAELLKIEGQVKIIGKIREDIVTLSMLGTILEVTDFQKVPNT